MTFPITMKTLVLISLHVLIGLSTGPLVFAQEPTEVPGVDESNPTSGLLVANTTLPVDTTSSSPLTTTTVTTTLPPTTFTTPPLTSASSPTTTQLSSTSSSSSSSSLATPPPTTPSISTTTTTAAATTTTTTTTTTTPTTTAESRVPLMQIPGVRSLLQSVLQILSDELGRVTIPGDLTERSEVIRSAMQNVNVMRIGKRIIAQDDIRNTFPKPDVVRQRCYDDVVDFIDASIGLRVNATSRDYYTTPWALLMLDAFGKPASGYLPGTLHWVGNYDECYEIHATIQAGTYLGSRPTAREESSEFYPKYCRVQALIPSILAGVGGSRVHGYWEELARRPSYLHWGMCLPESCGEHEVEALVRQAIELTGAPMTVSNAICFERDRDLESDAGAIFAISFLSVVGAVVVFCTVLEFAIFYGYLPWYSDEHRSNSDELSGSTGESSTYSSNGNDSQPGKNSFRDLHGEKSMEKGLTKPPSANQRTPLARDGRPKDVLGSDKLSSKAGSQSESDRKSTSLGLKLLQAFSIRYNATKLLAMSSKSDPRMLASIQGIRTLSMLWIVLGHTYTIGGTMDLRHIMFNVIRRIRETSGRLTFTFVAAGDLGVDTFFLISGVLVMMPTLREVRKGKGQGLGFWIIFALHRIWRLTPVYMMVLMTGTTLYKYAVDGPLKSEPYMMFEHCEDHWWTNLLYLNNIIKPLEMCMPWSWYLAVDLQLFMLSPLFIVLLYKKYLLGILGMVGMVILGSVATLIAVLKNPGQMLTMFSDDRDFFEHVYVAPYTRMAAFFMGMLLAVALEDVGDKFRLSKLKSLFTWLVLTGVALFLIMIPHDQWKDEGDFWPKGTQAVYESLKRPLWSLFIGWIIFTCQTGQGGFLADFLKWKGFQPLARLTYAVYLVHPMIITFFLYERNLPIDLEDGVMIYRFFGNVIMSFLFGAVYTLLFESPLMAVEKIVLRKN